MPACVTGVKTRRVHLCRVADDCVIHCGRRRAVTIWWIIIKSYRQRLIMVFKHLNNRAGAVIETDASGRIQQTRSSSRPGGGASGGSSRYESSSRRFESRSETRRETSSSSKPQPPAPPVRRRLFSPDQLNNIDGPTAATHHPQQQARTMDFSSTVE